MCLARFSFADLCKSPVNKQTLNTFYTKKPLHLCIKDAESCVLAPLSPSCIYRDIQTMLPDEFPGYRQEDKGEGENTEHEREEGKEPGDVSFAYHKLKAELRNIPLCSRK